jgi:hypothetical protein
VQNGFSHCRAPRGTVARLWHRDMNARASTRLNTLFLTGDIQYCSATLRGFLVQVGSLSIRLPVRHLSRRR